jgi:hypothetical protein
MPGVGPGTQLGTGVDRQAVRRGPLYTNSAVIFITAFCALLALHFPVLRLPYFWDEAGYYVPAARDLLLSGSLIPHSVPSNAHPPLVMAYLATWWKLFGYAPLVTRTAMLVVAALAVTGVFRLALRISNFEIALASAVCTAVYPVFFAQSTLAQVDLATAALTFWAMAAYVDQRKLAAAGWFALAALAKETAILAPAALLVWEAFCRFLRQRPAGEPVCNTCRSGFLLLPFVPLAGWYAFHHARTGYVFGNPEFFRYNVSATLEPLRIALAFLQRVWQTLGYFGLYLLTAATAIAMLRPPLKEGKEGPRRRIAIAVQLGFAAVLTAYLIFMAVVGGAVLARYMLPVVPLVIILCVSTLRRRFRHWRWLVGLIAAVFVMGWFLNPPYGFSLEDNLAYRDYVGLHQRAETVLEARYPRDRVLTAWPAADEITRPYLGYVTRPMRVLEMENFSLEQVMAAADSPEPFDVALIFSTKYDPPLAPFSSPRWLEWKMRFFGYHRDLPPEAAAQILGGRVVYREARHGQWIAIIQVERAVNARLGAARAPLQAAMR